MTTLLLTAVHGARMEAGVAQPEICLQIGFRVKILLDFVDFVSRFRWISCQEVLNTTCRSSCRSCTSEQAGGEKAR